MVSRNSHRSETPLLFVLISNFKLVKEIPGVCVARTLVEKGRLLAIFDKRASGLSHEENVFLRRSVKVWVIKLGCAKRFATGAS